MPTSIYVKIGNNFTKSEARGKLDVIFEMRGEHCNSKREVLCIYHYIEYVSIPHNLEVKS